MNDANRDLLVLSKTSHLNDAEKELFSKSAAAVRSMNDAL